MTVMKPDRVRAIWETELDRLEIDVLRVERLLKGLSTMPAEPWDPPRVPGQLPGDLAPRAQDLLDRQGRARSELQRALLAAQQQIAFTGRVSDVTAADPPQPVYLDVEA